MRSALFIFLLSFALIGLKAQMSPQTKEITERFFPDPEIEINTPAFQKKKGFTDYEEMMAFIQTLLQNHSEVMSLTFIGTSQKGREIPMVRLHKDNGSQKLKVWLQGCIHGNEPASTEGLLFLMDRLLNDPAYAYLLDNIEIAIVPMANIDGSEKMERYAANGLDLNRDQTKLEAPESVYLKQAFSNYGAQVGMDFHEYRPYRKNFTKLSTFGVTNGFDVMFLYSGNLNVPQILRNFTKDVFVKNAQLLLDSKQITHHDYFTETTVSGGIEFRQGSLNARSSATSYALANTISTLIEVRGVGIGKTSYKRRVYTTFLVAFSYLRTAYEKEEEIRKVLERSADEKGEVVVKSKSRVSEQPLTFIDIEKSEKILLNVRLRDAWHTTATQSRECPAAYLILPDFGHLVEKLQVLGLTVDTLDSPAEISIQKYTLTDYQQDAEKYEGVNRQTVNTLVSDTTLRFPAGTFVVRMDQARARLAVEVLEPENHNSFVSFDVLHTTLGAELPVYRSLKSTF